MVWLGLSLFCCSKHHALLASSLSKRAGPRPARTMPSVFHQLPRSNSNFEAFRSQASTISCLLITAPALRKIIKRRAASVVIRRTRSKNGPKLTTRQKVADSLNCTISASPLVYLLSKLKSMMPRSPGQSVDRSPESSGDMILLPIFSLSFVL